MNFQCFLESTRTRFDYFLDARRVVLVVGEQPGWNSAAVLTHWIFDILTPKMSKQWRNSRNKSWIIHFSMKNIKCRAQFSDHFGAGDIENWDLEIFREKSWNVTCNRGINVSRERRKALRVIPRGKQRLTVYRAHQVWFHWACQKSVYFDNANGNISKSV